MTKEEFTELAQQWEQGTCFMSSCSQIMAHPAVTKFEKASNDLIPWIIECYREDCSGRWDLLLKKITGITPYGHKDRGDIKRNQQSWLGWWEKGRRFGT